MTDRQKEKIKRLGLKIEDFEPKEEQTTIEDLMDALNLLTDIVLGSE